MWFPRDVKRSEAYINYATAGLGAGPGFTAVADGVTLINDIRSVDFDVHGFQALVCTGCGIPSCIGGNWVAVRQLSGQLIWIPAWDRMLEDFDDDDLEEFGPPHYLSERGLPVFSPSSWDGIYGDGAFERLINSAPALRSDELVRWIQWTAPHKILGTFPDKPSIQADQVVATSSSSTLDEMLRRTDDFLGTLFSRPRALSIAPPIPREDELFFYLDPPGTLRWGPVTNEKQDIVFSGRTALSINLAAQHAVGADPPAG